MIFRLLMIGYLIFVLVVKALDIKIMFAGRKVMRILVGKTEGVQNNVRRWKPNPRQVNLRQPIRRQPPQPGIKMIKPLQTWKQTHIVKPVTLRDEQGQIVTAIQPNYNQSNNNTYITPPVMNTNIGNRVQKDSAVVKGISFKDKVTQGGSTTGMNEEAQLITGQRAYFIS